MTSAKTDPKTIFLKDQTPPPYLIPSLSMTVRFDEEVTLVTTTMELKRHHATPGSDLKLNGEMMSLKSIKINGETLTDEQYSVDDKSLTLINPAESFTLETMVAIKPQDNKTLEGVYKSGDIFCSQCEPEGFRRITYFLDRPDVMSVFTVRVEADKKRYPVLLSNGNPGETGDLEDGYHFTTWHDPFAKPCYLFAIVAGDLGHIADSFKTMSGRNIDLKIYCDKGNEDRCSWAMESLKRAMTWDEENYGLEYDLDIFNIVAVDAFNFGAMENKGLNIFNSSAVLAKPSTATDGQFKGIEAIVAHEYFHNWSGNRVTCQNWFQITLKEGLTVFRDQEFSSDMHSRPVTRINKVQGLRAGQFAEDNGPMVHPIRPESYIQINNFYTATVYSKGSEVIRMMHTLIGSEAYRKATDLYFSRHDGQAVTCEDFVACMSEASGRDFSQFMNWYHQAGTPVLDVDGAWNESTATYTLKVKQSCRETPETKNKKPFVIPLSVGLLDSSGNDMPLSLEGDSTAPTTRVLTIDKESQTFTFTNINENPVPSLLRNFSAPVRLNDNLSNNDRLFLLSNDSDAFCRFEAGQKLMKDALDRCLSACQKGESLPEEKELITALGKVLNDGNLDNDFKTCLLNFPSVSEIVEEMDICDYTSADTARRHLMKRFASTYREQLTEIYNSLKQDEYQIDSTAFGERSLKNGCLAYLSLLEDEESLELITAQFDTANNMTDEFSSLSLLASSPFTEARDKTLGIFEEKWQDTTLVFNMWLAAQGGSKRDDLLEHVKKLESHTHYDRFNPNKVRSLVGSFANNFRGFHAEDGLGYRFVADKVIECNNFNPMLASGLSRTFSKFSKLDTTRKPLMQAELERILAHEGLSNNVYEVVKRTLDQGQSAAEA